MGKFLNDIFGGQTGDKISHTKRKKNNKTLSENDTEMWGVFPQIYATTTMYCRRTMSDFPVQSYCLRKWQESYPKQTVNQ